MNVYSYHLISENIMRCYWYHKSTVIRLFKSYIKCLWKIYFVKSKINGDILNNLQDLSDISFAKFNKFNSSDIIINKFEIPYNNNIKVINNKKDITETKMTDENDNNTVKHLIYSLKEINIYYKEIQNYLENPKIWKLDDNLEDVLEELEDSEYLTDKNKRTKLIEHIKSIL